MKYTFSFKETNYGSIEIEADHRPGESEVIDAIMNGGAFFKDTEYSNISIDSAMPSVAKKPRNHDRDAR
jgi:hypothetical protein